MPALPRTIPAGPLELRVCGPEHLDRVMAAIEASRAELARWLPWADPMPTRAFERDFLVGAAAAFEADRDWAYLIFERDGEELVGGCGLHPRGEGQAEIGYWVRSDRTGRGYATAAAGALRTVALEYLPRVDSIVIRMDQANGASAAVPPKLGFTLTGEDPLREVLTEGHTGRGWIWTFTRPS